MKKLIFTISLLTGCFMFLVSCTNGIYDAQPNVDKSNSANPLVYPTYFPDGNTVFGWVLNGDTQNAFHANAALLSGGLTITGTAGPTAIPSQQVTINIKIDSYKGPGVYTMNTYGSGTYTYKGFADASSYGTITVTEDNYWIIGTFSFITATGNKITNGNFTYVRFKY